MHAEFPDSTYQSIFLVGTMDSATVSATPTQQQSTDVQTGLPVSTIIIILSTVIPSTLVLLMLVCTVVVIILIVRWRITRKQVDTAHEHTGKLWARMEESGQTSIRAVFSIQFNQASNSFQHSIQSGMTKLATGI